ncbi:transposase (plasmid) [Piscirickettsia salmonis]|uniref:integrase core domain-containing protein n=1 Tax=Piscirickettsia salmonis TaxID=1238 RepID=UPI0009BB010F|nr:transposase [Piscirickettsia salmonis]QHS30944.1 transposase [Piscirickettsia salmonis]
MYEYELSTECCTSDDGGRITEPWVDQYNNERPHESLANLSPINFKKMRDKTTEIPL